MTMAVAACATCLRLRVFFSVALPLVALIYLQPAAAVRLAALLPTPSTIGWGLVVGSVVGFWIKRRAWRRKRTA